MSLLHLERRIERHAAKMRKFERENTVPGLRAEAADAVYKALRFKYEDSALLSLATILQDAARKKADATDDLERLFALYMVDEIVDALRDLRK